MDENIYKRLARHLDQLPGRFPATDSGVELRLLRSIFTPELAELALHLTLSAEEAPVIAERAGLPEKQVSQMLVEMANKGLIFDVQPRNGPPRYMASQFVVGIWEYQLNNLNPEFIHDADEYFKALFDFERWRKTPQLRTIPVGTSLTAQAEVMPYEQAEILIRSNKRFAVANCICRKERKLVGEGCDKPQEVCLSMGLASDFYVRHGLGRSISMEEALHILEIADEAGLVLQPNNAQKANFMCCCCGDCCGVLRNIKRHPRPAEIVSSAYYAESDDQICNGCGDCVERCQMEAINVDEGYAMINLERCIGCGLCVTTCSTEAIHLVRKAVENQPYVPYDIGENSMRMMTM